MNKTTLLHGVGSAYWKRGQLVAVVEWERAALGDPLADVAVMRLDILWWRGIDAMQEFTKYYRVFNNIDFTNLPHWDLATALRSISRLEKSGFAESIQKDLREKHHWFVEQALKKLSTP